MTSSLYCHWCKNTLNSKAQWDQHLTGSKHLKAQNAEKVLSLIPTGTNPFPSTAIKSNSTLLSADDMVDFSSAISEGVYKCKMCEDFVCMGIDDMRQHLISLDHQQCVKQHNANDNKSNGHNTVTIIRQPFSAQMLSEVVDQTSSLNLDTPSAAILQVDGVHYKCRECENFECSGIIPMKQHLEGQKHKKNVQRKKELATLQVSCRMTKSESSPSSSGALVDISGNLQADGRYKCKDCENFFCSGPTSMREHLNGKIHLKNIRKKESSPNKKSRLDTMPQISVQSAIRILSSPEQRVEKTWKHPIACGFKEDETFAAMSLPDKIASLSPHFAFIGKDDKIPDLIHYLKK